LVNLNTSEFKVDVIDCSAPLVLLHVLLYTRDCESLSRSAYVTVVSLLSEINVRVVTSKGESSGIKVVLIIRDFESTLTSVFLLLVLALIAGWLQGLAPKHSIDLFLLVSVSMNVLVVVVENGLALRVHLLKVDVIVSAVLQRSVESRDPQVGVGGRRTISLHVD